MPARRFNALFLIKNRKMRTLLYSIGNLLIISLLAGCISRTEKESRVHFQRVDTLVAGHESRSALQLLDSIMIWYKEDYGIVGEAIKKRDTIALAYHQEVTGISESLLKGLEPRITALSADFLFTPGEPGQPGTYVHKRQTLQSSWNRTFLKIGLNEEGDIWLTSHYYGKSWIDHTNLRVYEPGSYILTDTIPLGHDWNRKVEDLGDRWETVEFREGSDAGAIAFIADNWQKSVKVRLTGKTFHYIVLESYDKEAIRKGWELAQVLKERHGIRETIRFHQAELRKLGV